MVGEPELRVRQGSPIAMRDSRPDMRDVNDRTAGGLRRLASVAGTGAGVAERLAVGRNELPAVRAVLQGEFGDAEGARGDFAVGRRSDERRRGRATGADSELPDAALSI